MPLSAPWSRPLTTQGGLDVAGAVKLARWLVENGNDGLVLTGTTGEATTLSDSEKFELWKAVRQAVAAPVLAGTGTASTAHSVELTRMAEDAGVDGALVVTPYYNRPSQAGIDAHFRAIAAASRLPVIAYDIPKRTGRELKTSTLVGLARDGVIAGVKDAAGSPAATAVLIEQAPERLRGLQRGRLLHPAPAGGGRRGRHQCGLALGRP